MFKPTPLIRSAAQATVRVLRSRLVVFGTLSVLTLGACDMGKIAVSTTSKVLDRGKYAVKQEPDFDLAARAIPGSLKTVESFHMVDPDNHTLTNILAEGFCQYASGFIEDEWEVALIAKDFEEAEHQSERASKAFFRCMGYSLHILGKSWQKAILGDIADVEKRAAKTGFGQRDALFWTGVGLAGAINHNKDNPAMVAQVTKARVIVDRAIVLDNKYGQKDQAKRATAHVVRAMLHLALPKALGGDPEAGKAEFELALQVSENKFLLARVLLARRYAVAVQNRELFHASLVQVLQTDPAIWPEQRLANEIAHRRAKRYLKHEKEFF
jgi:hypothetical protein